MEKTGEANALSGLPAVKHADNHRFKHRLVKDKYRYLSFADGAIAVPQCALDKTGEWRRQAFSHCRQQHRFDGLSSASS